MKKLLILVIISMTIFASSCKKEKINYELTFSAQHYYTYTNQSGVGQGFAYYTFQVTDEDFNQKFFESDYVRNNTISKSFQGESGDYVMVQVGVYDVYDYGVVSCFDENGNVLAVANTDNLFIDDYSSIELDKRNDSVLTISYQLK
jgi:hypothetical protein